eukprot:426259-Pelagomonas_calceolata.AAC.1
MNHSFNFEAATPHNCSCCRGLTGRKEHPGASSSSDSLPHPAPDLQLDVRKGILHTDGCSCVLWTCCVGGKGFVAHARTPAGLHCALQHSRSIS